MFWRKLLPNFSICVHLAMIVVIYLDMRNPMMGFLEGMPFLVLAAASVVSAIGTSVVLYGDSRSGRYNRKRKKANAKPEISEEIEKNQ